MRSDLPAAVLNMAHSSTSKVRLLPLWIYNVKAGRMHTLSVHASDSSASNLRAVCHASRILLPPSLMRGTAVTNISVAPTTCMYAQYIASMQVSDTAGAALLRFTQAWLPALLEPLLALYCAYMLAGQQRFMVPARPLRHILAELELSSVSLLKVDTEGAELEVWCLTLAVRHAML